MTLKGLVQKGGVALCTSAFLFAACEQDTVLPPKSETIAKFDFADPALAARAELNEIAKVILRDEAVRQEVHDLAVQPRFIDLYVDLDVLLNPEAHSADEFYGVPNRGAFRQAFDVAYDPEVHTALAVELKPEAGVGLIQRSGELDGSGTYLYCPYCEGYSAEQMKEPFAIAVDTFVNLGDDVQEVPGTRIGPESTSTVSVDDDYMETTPTFLIIGEPDGGLQGFGGPPEIYEDYVYQVTRCSDATGECCDYEITVIWENGDLNEYTRKLRCYKDPAGGGTIGGGTGAVWEDCSNTTGVWTDRIQSIKQWDNLFDGGSEMRLGRIGPENVSSASGRQITSSGWSKYMRKDLTRTDIRRERELVWRYSFDDEWQCEEAPQYVIYYEEDEDTKRSFTAKAKLSAKVKVKVPGVGEVEAGPGAELSYKHERSSDDDLIFEQFFERNEFFRWNDKDNGCGLSYGWRKYACENGDGYFTLPSRF